MLATSLVVGGWRGELTISGDVLTVVSEDGEKSVSIDAKELKRGAFNSNNGLWIFHLKNGKKVRLQSAGVLLSADRTDAGRAANSEIRELMRKHNVKGIRL